MRKLLLLALLGLALAPAACGGQKAAPAGRTPVGSPPAGPVTIDLWHSEQAANLETLERLADRFNASQDAVRVRAVYQGNEEETLTKLMGSLASGDAPAIVLLPEPYVQRLVDSGAVTPVQDFIDHENYDVGDLDPRAVQYYTVDDRLWSMPLCAGVALLYYNKTVFREAGLDPERPPGDLEELRQYSEKILRRDESGQVTRSGIAIDIQDWTERVLAAHGDLFVDNNNGRDGRATKVLFDNDTGRRFFQWWHDMVEDGLAINVGRNPTFVEGFLAMASGRAAMTFSYSSALRSVEDALEEGVQGVEIGVGPLPGVPGGTGASLLLGRGLWVLEGRPAEEKVVAWQFIKWLMEPEQQAEWFAGSGFLPVSRSAVDLPAAQDVLNRYPEFRVALDLYLGIPATPATLGALLGPIREVREPRGSVGQPPIEVPLTADFVGPTPV